MYKSMSLLVLVALAACVVSMETQDQETAEQYYQQIHGVYPSWYPYGAAFNGVRAFPGYPLPAPYSGYPAASYPVPVSPYNAYPYGRPYGAVPNVADAHASGGFGAAPAATPVKA